MKRVAFPCGWLLAVCCAVVPARALAQDQVSISRGLARQYLQQESLPQLRPSDAVALLSGILIIAPEEFQVAVSRPESRNGLASQAFARCVLGLSAFAGITARSAITANRREWEEIGARHGFDPDVAGDIVKGNSQMAALAREVADEALLAATLARGGTVEPRLREVFQQRAVLTNYARNAFAQSADTLPQIVAVASQSGYQTMYSQRVQQALVVTRIICP
jgi:hypothetical protein